MSENGIFVKLNKWVSPYRTKGRSNVKKQALSPVQRQRPFTGAEPRTLHRYRTKGDLHRYRTKGFTGTEPSPFRIEPKSLYQCKTKNPSPVENQGPLYRYRTKPFHWYRGKGPSPVQNQEPFTGAKPRAALPIYRTKGPSPVQNQRMPLYQCPLPFSICWVQYNTVVQYNIEAALWTIFTLQTSFAGREGRWGSYELLYCSPLLSSCYL